MGKRQGPIKVKCSNCDKEFGTWAFKIKKQKNIFCSRKCGGEWESKFKVYKPLTPKQEKAFRDGHRKWVSEKCGGTEHRLKLSLAAKKAGIRPPNRTGTKLTPEHKAKISVKSRRKRKENPISPVCALVRKNYRMTEWRQKVFIRDCFTCQNCGAKSGNGHTVYLEAHHKTSFASLFKQAMGYMPLIDPYEAAILYMPMWDISNGETLCRSCHDKTRKGRGPV
jgi:5-methylcytosine-specific restriction endonuclease McrA